MAILKKLVFHIFQPPPPLQLDAWAIIAPVPAELRSRSDQPQHIHPPFPKQEIGIESLVNVKSYVLMIKFARALLKLLDLWVSGDF